MLRPDSAIAFGSGYGLAFDLIRPPATVDVLLVASRMAGTTARARYLEGQGFWACVGVEADRKRRPTSANPGPRSRRAGLESCQSIGKQEDRRSSPFTWRRR